jgi:hypothetical protein
MVRGAPGWNNGGDDDDATLPTLEVEVARLQRHRMPVKTMDNVGYEMF